MNMFKSELEKSIERIRKGLETIKNEYAGMSGALESVVRSKALNDEQKETVKNLRQFNFYPENLHDANRFFEASQAPSYRLQRAAQLGQIKASRKVPPRVISVKGRSTEFAKKIGLPVPQVTYPFTLNELSFETPSVVKPIYADGGKAVYAITKELNGQYYDHFSDKYFKSQSDLVDRMQKQIAKKPTKDSWIQEEMIVGESGSPKETLDVKFYLFYGRVGLVLQVDRWRGRKYQFFTPAGEPVDAGKHNVEDEVKPIFTDRLTRVAKKASLKIPWPHVRIDFLVSTSDWRFGEFTLRPGAPASFNDFWDRKLGKLYVQAQARLYDDFIDGKDFSEYRSMIDDAQEKK